MTSTSSGGQFFGTIENPPGIRGLPDERQWVIVEAKGGLQLAYRAPKWAK
jgi:hypothetical protein